MTINVGSTALFTTYVGSTALCQPKLCLEENSEGNTTLVTYIVNLINLLINRFLNECQLTRLIELSTFSHNFAPL